VQQFNKNNTPCIDKELMIIVGAHSLLWRVEATV